MTSARRAAVVIFHRHLGTTMDETFKLQHISVLLIGHLSFCDPFNL